MSKFSDDILAREPTDAEKAEQEALVKDEAAAHGAPPTGGKPGDEVVLAKGPDGKQQMIGKHTGLHYNGKGQDGQTFQDVYGERKDKQRMDKPSAERGQSGMIRTG